MLMNASQAGLAAYPMMMNAGWKTAMYERYADDVRVPFENWAYASYLLGVHKVGNQCSTPFGSVPFKWSGSTHRVEIHPRYFWPIGNPVQEYTDANIDQYKPTGHVSYVRRFSNGIVLVNPTNNADNNVPLGANYKDPGTHVEMTAVNMPAKSGRILLRADTGARTGKFYSK